jgi:hypothetical protein
MTVIEGKATLIAGRFVIDSQTRTQRVAAASTADSAVLAIYFIPFLG